MILASVLGGVAIGVASGLLILGSGHIAGISGIFGKALRGEWGDHAWRLAYLAGLMTPPGLLVLFSHLPSYHLAGGLGQAALGGLAVGVGTALGNGCTSGHGVCGLANQSPRSLLATVTFMATGLLSVWMMRHLLHLGG